MNLNDDTIELFEIDLEYYTQIEKQINNTKNSIKSLRDKLKKLSEEKKEIEIKLSDTMKKNNLSEINLRDNKGIIEYKVTNSIVPLKQDDIKMKLIDFFENGPGSKLAFNSLTFEKKGIEIYNYIYLKENRDKIKKEILKSKILS